MGQDLAEIVTDVKHIKEGTGVTSERILETKDGTTALKIVNEALMLPRSHNDALPGWMIKDSAANVINRVSTEEVWHLASGTTLSVQKLMSGAPNANTEVIARQPIIEYGQPSVFA